MVCLVSLAQAQQSYRQSTADYIAQYKDIAILEMQRYGIPASIKLGQGILESGSGNSELARNANNHFGIKCKSTWTGKTFHKDDDAKDECFRKYEKVLDSYEDHSKFLKQNQRYAFLFDLPPSDYKAWAYGLKKAGYATNPKYAELLIKTIEDHSLHLFDVPAKEDKRPISEATGKSRDKMVYQDVTELELRDKKTRSISLRNRIKSVIANDGDTPESLAIELNMMTWQIYKYNDLKKGEQFNAGEIVYLQPKRKKAIDASHKVVDGQSIRDVSQLHGVKINRIRKLNQLDDAAEIKAGMVLKLR
jgi:LysM repeat protein